MRERRIDMYVGIDSSFQRYSYSHELDCSEQKFVVLVFKRDGCV